MSPICYQHHHKKELVLYLGEMILQFALGVPGFVDADLERDVDGFTLLFHVVSDLLQDSVDQRPQVLRVVALLLCRQDVLVGETLPVVNRHRAGRKMTKSLQD